MKGLKICIILIGLMLILTGCGLGEEYETLDKGYSIRLIETEKNAGFFEWYKGGRLEDQEEYKRNTNVWEYIDDILILNDGERYYKVYQDCIIRVKDEDDEPTDWEYIAPIGDAFDYKIGRFEFFKDRTFKFKSGTVETNTGFSNTIYRYGEYYRENNTIYVKFDDGTEYFPQYYIYDGDHIIEASYVYVEK